MEEVIKKAVSILKNNCTHRISRHVPKKEKQNYRDFMVGMYNRFDELGLIYSKLKKISFNKAVEDLDIKEY